MIDLNSFANGALAEQFNSEFQKVMENMSDINTDPKRQEKLSLHYRLQVMTNVMCAHVKYKLNRL